MNIKNALKTLEKYENVIWDNERQFLDDFCYSSDDLSQLSFNSRNCKIVYILNNGQHIADQKPIQEIIDWVEAYLNRSEK